MTLSLHCVWPSGFFIRFLGESICDLPVGQVCRPLIYDPSIGHVSTVDL